MRPLSLTVLTALVAITLSSPSSSQDGVTDFDRDCLSSPITTSETLGGCALMVVEIADLENASPDVVNDRIRKTADNANAGGGTKIKQDACSKMPLASYRGGAGNAGQMYAALCTGF